MCTGPASGPYPLVGELGGQAGDIEDVPLDDADALESTATGRVHVLLAFALAALPGRLLPRRDPDGRAGSGQGTGWASMVSDAANRVHFADGPGTHSSAVGGL